MYILLLAFWSSGWNSYLRTPLRKFSNLLRVFGAAVVTPSGWKLSSSEKIDVAITTILIKETSQPWQWRRITFHLCWRESSPSGFQDPQKPPLSLHPAFRLPPPCLFLYPAKKKYWIKNLMYATSIIVKFSSSIYIVVTVMIMMMIKNLQRLFLCIGASDSRCRHDLQAVDAHLL